MGLTLAARQGYTCGSGRPSGLFASEAGRYFFAGERSAFSLPLLVTKILNQGQ